MIKIKEINKTELEIQQVISSRMKKETDIQISIPKQLDFEQEHPDNEYFNKFISKRRSLYKSKNPSLTLLYAKYLEKKDLPKEQLDISLSLFSYQFLKKLNDYKSEINKAEKKNILDKISELLIDTQKTLESFRSLEISDSKNQETYTKIDFLLSFEVEQLILEMIFNLKGVDGSDDLISVLKTFAQEENKYRKTKKYSEDDLVSKETLLKETSDKDRHIRLVNKMDMRKKLIELPLNISEEFFELGKREQNFAIAISTGLIMFAFAFLLLQARLMGLDMSMQFVFGITFLYIFRDIFRETFKSYFYKKLMKNKPILRSLLSLKNKEDIFGSTFTWFNLDIPNSKIIKKNNQISSNNEKIFINYKEIIKLGNFNHYDFKRLKTYTTFDLSPILKEIKRNDKKLFVYENDYEIEEVSLPRQYKLTITIKETITNRAKRKITERTIPEIKEVSYVVLVNRNEIIKITQK